MVNAAKEENETNKLPKVSNKSNDTLGIIVTITIIIT